MSFRPPILIVAVILLAGGCDSLPIEDWAGVPEPKRAQAQLTQYGHDVRFVSGQARLPAAERQHLDAFIARADIGYGDTVHVVTGAAADAEVTRRRSETVAAFLALRQVPVEPLLSDFGAAQPPPATVRVLVRRYVVTLPGCPDWSGEPGNTVANVATSNWGCATASNLGLMIADPGELIAGRRAGPVDADYAVLAVQRYRKGEIRPLSPEDVGTIESQQKPTTGGSE